jgi:hypothetical protein
VVLVDSRHRPRTTTLGIDVDSANLLVDAGNALLAQADALAALLQ